MHAQCARPSQRMGSALAAVKGGNEGKRRTHKELTPLYPSVNTGDLRFLQ